MKQKEQKLRERLKANYESYIQQLKAKPAPDLIEMATEISADQFVYEELSMEEKFSDYLDYLLQFENPLEVVSIRWLDDTGCDYQKKLDFMLFDMAKEWMEKGSHITKEALASLTIEQGVALC